jgi:hypothetical protein
MRKLLYISALCVYLSILLYACPIRPDSYQPVGYHKKAPQFPVELDTIIVGQDTVLAVTGARIP